LNRVNSFLYIANAVPFSFSYYYISIILNTYYPIWRIRILILKCRYTGTKEKKNKYTTHHYKKTTDTDNIQHMGRVKIILADCVGCSQRVSAVNERNKNGAKKINLIASLSSNHLRIITGQCVEHIATMKYSYLTRYVSKYILYFLKVMWIEYNTLPPYFYYTSSSQTSLFWYRYVSREWILIF